MFSVCNDKRTFTFYVNPYTEELVKVEGMDARMREALKGQGVTQMGSWFVADAWNWGTSAMVKWTYSKVSKSARIWHQAIEKKRADIERYKELKKGK